MVQSVKNYLKQTNNSDVLIKTWGESLQLAPCYDFSDFRSVLYPTLTGQDLGPKRYRFKAFSGATGKKKIHYTQRVQGLVGFLFPFQGCFLKICQRKNQHKPRGVRPSCLKVVATRIDHRRISDLFPSVTWKEDTWRALRVAQRGFGLQPSNQRLWKEHETLQEGRDDFKLISKRSVEKLGFDTLVR